MGASVQLDDATRTGLDWPFILERLASHCQTVRGKTTALNIRLAIDRAVIESWYAAVAELWLLDEQCEVPPMGGITDVEIHAVRAQKGEVLEAEDLRDVGTCLAALDRLKRWVGERAEEVPTLHELCVPIDVEPELRDTLGASFDVSGALCGKRYPHLGELRRRIDDLRQRVRQTLQAMLSDPDLAGVLQDQYITDRGGRLVLPIRSGARRGMGIVHDSSQSGETSFVEPTAVIEPQNELKGAEAELRREEHRVLADLSRQVGERLEAIGHGLSAATELDLAQARAKLGEALNGVIPQMVGGAVIRLKTARHPVLVLRGVDVIANDLEIDDKRAALVLTGPNAGGKTISLKTLGLVALMVRSGIPIAAADGAQVGVFGVIRTLMGDQQDVGDDLSTFSAHLVGIRTCLADAGPGALVLLDEIGVGTDPAQGAALGQAVIETLVTAGARVVVTTHYGAIKDLAAGDERMGLVGAIFADGRPTYRLEVDRAGHSHALAVARRMQIPDAVLERARALLDEGTRKMDDLIQALETEREQVRVKGEKQAFQQQSLEVQARRLDERTAKLDSRRDQEDAALREAYRERLKESEQKVKNLIAALQENPNLRQAGEVLDGIKQQRAEAAPEPPPPPTPPKTLAVGDTVDVPLLGGRGTVVAVSKGGRVEVDVRGKRVHLRHGELGAAPQPNPADRGPRPQPMADPGAGPVGVRTDHNTLDLRGMRVEEALEAVTDFLDELVLANAASAFLLHGHGTGALKSAIRQWLPKCRYARKWHAGGPEEGGDAFTVIEL